MLEYPDQFHFIRPLWFLMLIPLCACLWLLIARKPGSRNWEKICDPDLIPYVLIQGEGKKQTWSVVMFALIGLLTIIALAGPVWERLPQPVFRSDSALVIILDMSRSMDATDITPSRIERARFKVIDILNQHRDGETALIVYAGDAFTVTPLTSDVDTIMSLIPSLTTSIIPVQGHRADLALQMAGDILKQAGHARGEVLLITDEVDVKRDTKISAGMLSQGYRVSVLGVGTEQGAPIAFPNGGFLKDNSGNIVIPVLKPDELKQVADAGGGIYRTVSYTNSEISQLTGTFKQQVTRDAVSKTEFKSDTWVEQGPWLVLLLIPLVALSFRRGAIMILVILIMPLPQPVQALGWDELWLNQDQRAQRLLEQGRSEEAAELFANERWKAAAEYRSGSYEESLQTLKDDNDPESIYNKGNAFAKLGQFEEAIAAYEQVLEEVPGHEDAKYNLELIKKAMEKQKQQAQQDSSSGGDQQQADDTEGQQGEENQESSSAADESQTGESQQDDQESSQPGKNKQDKQQAPRAEQDQRQGEEDRADQAGRPGDESDQGRQNKDDMIAGNTELDEESQATEQWLRRIPDDPGGLLREKFRLQYKQRGMSRHNYGQDW